ncbi:hypothetical protein POTOM_034847 [Populus tomentosa]|uniref:Uncharacterized protein n=1 Tax=Populus tomentosa TaxID=118781 RepID=A0A8X8CPI4_POPTO|nr:hypothetical protein POTOM_034847 [Populus tomentosa]
MGFRLSAITRAKQILQLSPSAASQLASNVPKGCLAVYVGEIHKKRFIIPGTQLLGNFKRLVLSYVHGREILRKFNFKSFNDDKLTPIPLADCKF